MSYKRTFEGQEAVTLPPCMFLRSKAIYVTGDPDPKSPEEVGSTRFNCWCNKTQHVLGVDNALVERSKCVEGRGCFQARA